MQLLTLSLSAAFAITLPGLAPSLLADTLSLYNWGFNVDSVIYDKANTPVALLPAKFATAGFNFNEGLGSLTIAVAAAGPHAVAIYFDHNLNPDQPATDFSAAAGLPAPGESWEIGPGIKASAQLFNDFLADSYTDTNNAPQPADAATGLEFSFTNTPADLLSVITINVGTTAPTSGFYLHQFSTFSGTSPADIYISATVVPAPEPATALLFFAPLALLAWRAYTSTHARFLELSRTFSTIRNPRSPSTN